MEPIDRGNEPLRQPLPQQPEIVDPVQTGETQIDKSSSNPIPIVATLAIAAAIVLGWVLFSNPQGASESASYTPPANDSVRTVEPKQTPDQQQQLKEKVEPEK